MLHVNSTVCVCVSYYTTNQCEPYTQVLYERGMRSLAETTSITINLFRKISEVTLLPDVSHGNRISPNLLFYFLFAVIHRPHPPIWLLKPKILTGNYFTLLNCWLADRFKPWICRQVRRLCELSLLNMNLKEFT